MTNNLHSLVYDFMPIATALISDDCPFTKMNVTWILAFCAIVELHFGILTDPSFNDMKCKKMYNICRCWVEYCSSCQFYSLC